MPSPAIAFIIVLAGALVVFLWAAGLPELTGPRAGRLLIRIFALSLLAGLVATLPLLAWEWFFAPVVKVAS